MVETERMVLTTWLPEDFEDLSGLHSDAETMRWIRPGRPETPDETRARLASYLVDQVEGAAKWRVEDRRSGGFVGRAGFGGDVTHRELGYTLRREAWGRGLATELALALVAWHIEHPLCAAPGDLTAYAAVTNPASCRVLEKAGLTYVEERVHNGQASAYYRL
jgi:ribosomal-protein-alanine N-acetyltransferase